MALSMKQRRRTSLTIQYAIFFIVVIILAVTIDWPNIVDKFFNFRIMAQQFPDVITTALKNTIIYTALGFVFSMVLGILLALMKLSSVGPYRWVATAYIEFFRGVPALLVFLAFGFGIPTAFKVNLDNYLTVMLALGIVGSAYIAETLRAGLQAVPKGQYEAARSLGMSHSRAMISVVIPQAFKIILPPLTNEIIIMTKDSSLIYLLGLLPSQFELALFGKNAIAAPEAGLTPLVVAGACYLVITLPLGWLARKFESRQQKANGA